MGATHFSGPLHVAGVEIVDVDGNVVADVEVGDLEEIVDASGNELLEFDTVASAVNYLGVANAATGNNPILYLGGEADTGLTFMNDQAEEILILQSAATSVNELTVTSAAANAPVVVSATGDDTNINLRLEPKGTGLTELFSDEAGATGSVLQFTHDSASPATSDVLGRLQAVGDDDGGAATTYGYMDAVIEDASAAAEFGSFKYYVQNGTGSNVLSARIYHDGSGGIVEAGDGALAGIFQSSGNFDVTLQTGNSTTGTIAIVDGADGAITFAPNGNGAVAVTAAVGGLNINASTAILGCLDEDNMASDSATNVATQQSIKKYVDDQISGSDSLQEAYNVGNSITVADTVNTSLVFTQNDVTNNPDAVQIENAGTGDELQLTSTAAGAAGVVLRLHHDSASPAVSDVVGSLVFQGEDDASATEEYGRIDVSVLDAAAANPDGRMSFYVDVAGTATELLRLDNSGNGLQVGGSGVAGVVSSNGAANLTLGTGSGTGASVAISDGAAGGISLNPDTTGEVEMLNADAGAVGSVLRLNHESASPAIADVVGRLIFAGLDDGTNAQDYGRIDTVATAVANGSEAGRIQCYAANASGTLAVAATFAHDGSNGQIHAGDGSSAGIFQSGGDNDVVLQTGNSTTGLIKIVDGADGDIEIAPNGSGLVDVDGDIINTGRVGTAGTNVTVEEFGDGRNHTTVLTLTSTAMGTIAGAGAAAFGALVYTFPAGVHVHEVSYQSVGVTTAGGTKSDTPELGIGSLIGSGANATLNAVGATAHDYITATAAAAADGTPLVLGPVGAVAGILTGISLNAVGDTKAVNFNAADTWAAGAAGALTADGTITLKWTSLEA